jgi:site-specific DNA-methyltransferase (adenine-specific)
MFVFTTVWQAADGISRLYLGDALQILDSLDAESVDCVWTDPPYLLSNGGVTCVAGQMVSVDKGEWDRSQGIELDHAFNREWIAKCFRVLKPAGTIWVTGTLHVFLSVGMALQQEGFRIINNITWEKPNPPPNLACRCFTHSTETILWATKAPKSSRHKYTFNYDAMRKEAGGRQMQTVWRLPTPSAEEKRFGKHPTQKPVGLIARCLRASTNAGDVVLDPFAGSGSTAVAALRLSRAFIGCERIESYARIAARRINEAVFTANQPELLTGS